MPVRSRALLTVTLPAKVQGKVPLYRAAGGESWAFGEVKGLPNAAAPPPTRWNPPQAALTSAALFLKGARARSDDALRQPATLLAASLFDARAAALIEETIKTAKPGAVPYRIELEIPDDWLAGYPWELAELRGVGMIGRSPALAVVRRHPTALPPPRRDPPALCRVFALGASPEAEGLIELEVGEELGALRAVLTSTCSSVLVDDVFDLPWADVRRRVGGRAGAGVEPPHVFHFAGHGTLEGQLHFEARPTDGAKLAELLGTFRESLRLVVLHACHAGQQAATMPFGPLVTQLATSGVRAVVAVGTPFVDQLGPELTGALYAALARGDDVDVAVQEARAELATGALSFAWPFVTLTLSGPPEAVLSLPQPPRTTGAEAPLHHLDFSAQTAAMARCDVPSVVVVQGERDRGHAHIAERAFLELRRRLRSRQRPVLSLVCRSEIPGELRRNDLLGAFEDALQLGTTIGPTVYDRIRDALRRRAENDGPVFVCVREPDLTPFDTDAARLLGQTFRRLVFGEDARAVSACLILKLRWDRVGARDRASFFTALEDGCAGEPSLAVHQLDELPSSIPEDDIERFAVEWARYDDDAARKLRERVKARRMLNEEVLDMFERLVPRGDYDRIS